MLPASSSALVVLLQKVFDFFTGRGFSDAIAAGFVGTFQKESNFSHHCRSIRLAVERLAWRSGSVVV